MYLLEWEPRSGFATLDQIRVFPYIEEQVNEAQKLHLAGINLLERLGLDNIRLEQQPDGHFTYPAWNSPIIAHNGSSKTVKRGKIKVPA
jgi:hypothetical protein